MTFVAALGVAVFAASIVFILQRLTGMRARWLIPASAGAAMFGFTVWNDYTWFSRQAESLPAEVVVLDAFGRSAALQPWTMIVPAINRYRALDLRTIERHAERPEIVRGALYLAQRYQPTFTTVQLVDCAAKRHADAAEAGPDGLPPDAAWFALAPDDPLLRALCEARPAT